LFSGTVQSQHETPVFPLKTTSGEEHKEMEGMIMGRISQEQIPLEIQVLNRRAIEMSSHGNYLDALKIFSWVVFIAPRFAKAQYEMGRCLDNLGRHNEAVERYDKAIRFDPLFAQVLPATQTIRKNMGPCHE
jgi:tetratricopeptide (TPR) repeat protein